jgi:mannose-6-phosphate isomerase
VLSNVGEPVTIRYQGGEETLGIAESCILPAAIGPVEIVPSGSADLIYSYVPDMQIDVIDRLHQAGHTDEEIATLGHVF